MEADRGVDEAREAAGGTEEAGLPPYRPTALPPTALRARQPAFRVPVEPYVAIWRTSSTRPLTSTSHLLEALGAGRETPP